MRDISLFCPACNVSYDPAAGHLSCPAAGDGREHVLGKQLGSIGPSACQAAANMAEAWAGGARDPLTAFAALGAARQVAGPERYERLAARLQASLATHEGAPLAETPLLETPDLAQTLGHTGPFRIKNETVQLAGSHKARHLAGAMLFLQAVALAKGENAKPVLAISSCGNAALAAATVARAAGYVLRAFVPEDVNPEVAELLRQRGATVEIAHRLETGGGDPCYLAFRRAVTHEGAVPFCCSGRDNWSNIEGGQSLGYETALQWLQTGETPAHLVLQVGGGALARAVTQALEELRVLGVIDSAPRVHVCQTEGAFPFVRAWLLLLAEVAAQAGLDFPLAYSRQANPAGELARLLAFQNERRDLIQEAARYCAANFQGPAVQQTLTLAASQPARFMWAWDGAAPHSLAHGILDDETYDWFFLAKSLLRSGASAVAVPEPLVAEAHALALAHTPVKPSATGSSGLAGYLTLRNLEIISPQDPVGLFFTGIER